MMLNTGWTWGCMTSTHAMSHQCLRWHWFIYFLSVVMHLNSLLTFPVHSEQRSGYVTLWWVCWFVHITTMKAIEFAWWLLWSWFVYDSEPQNKADPVFMQINRLHGTICRRASEYTTLFCGDKFRVALPVQHAGQLWPGSNIIFYERTLTFWLLVTDSFLTTHHFS